MRLLICFFIFSLFIKPLSAGQFSERPEMPWGFDAELANSQAKKGKASTHTGQKICTSMIKFFQNYISPIDGPRSSFYPTSSQYALEAIQKYGVFKGIALGCDRLMRENKEEWVYETVNKFGTDRKLDPVR